MGKTSRSLNRNHHRNRSHKNLLKILELKSHPKLLHHTRFHFHISSTTIIHGRSKKLEKSPSRAWLNSFKQTKNDQMHQKETSRVGIRKISWSRRQKSQIRLQANTDLIRQWRSKTTVFSSNQSSLLLCSCQLKQQQGRKESVTQVIRNDMWRSWRRIWTRIRIRHLTNWRNWEGVISSWAHSTRPKTSPKVTLNQRRKVSKKHRSLRKRLHLPQRMRKARNQSNQL